MQTDPRIAQLAGRSQNFGFLLEHQPLLVAYGAGAEALVFSDPNAALIKSRQFVEVLVKDVIARVGLPIQEPDVARRIDALAADGVLRREVRNAMRRVRRAGNRAAHENLSDPRKALTCVRDCFELGVWLDRAVTGWRGVRAFVPPTPPDELPTAELDRLREDLEQLKAALADAQLRLEGAASPAGAEATARLEAERLVAGALADRAEARALTHGLEARVDQLGAAHEAEFARAAHRVSSSQRELFVGRALRPEPLSEPEARRVIDRMLEAAGWVVQDFERINPHAGTGVAVREFTLVEGWADYLLYVGQRIVGVIEAKREGIPLTGVEWQTDRYANSLPPEYRRAVWRKGSALPFRYESTGTETHFTNRLDPDARAREVSSFHRPETIARWMREADDDPGAPTFRARVRQLPELPTEHLRSAQVDAVLGLEQSLAHGRQRALIQMASGAGKTHAAVTAIYRLLKHARAHRVLFLVDRNNLGRQALGELRNYVTPDDGRKLAELYNVERLTGTGMLDSSKVVISTIQRMHSVLKGQDLPGLDDDNPDFDSYDVDEPVEVGYQSAVPPETFDLVIVDECHRSIYGKWRAVLEYFDAHLVGLTATPVKQTFGFFQQNLVSSYTYEEAVADQVNVDFDVYRVRTEITERGDVIEAGTVVPKRDRRTRRQRYEELDDDFTYSGAQVGRSVIATDQIRMVLETFRDRLFTEIFPGRHAVPKTLVFCRDDNHAEEVVQQVREVFGKGNDFAAKITYTAGRDGRRPDDLIQELRNSPELRVAVTVDMIATGTDVRPLECVLFLRDVKSRVTFEQMKGRGARTIPPTDFQAVTPDARAKDRFVIVDAVGVTEHPLAESSSLQRHTDRQVSLEQLLRKTATLTIGEAEVSTLASRLARLDQQLDDAERAAVESLAGQPLAQIVGRMVRAVSPEAVEEARERGGEDAVHDLVVEAVRPLTTNPELRERLLAARRALDITTDEVNPDTLISAAGVPDEAKARRVIASWHQFLEDHQNQITALRVLRDRGRPSYQELRDLADRLPPTLAMRLLWRAHTAVGNATVAPTMEPSIPDLIALIRYDLGLDGELRPYRAIVEDRFTAWLREQEHAGTRFTDEQRWWLERIRDAVATGAGFTSTQLDDVPFTQRGGTDGFLNAFDTRARDLIEELDQELSA